MRPVRKVVVAIVAGVVISYCLPPLYAKYLGSEDAFFGEQLNFMNSVFLVAVISAILHVAVSLMTQPDPEKSKLTWVEMGGHDPKKAKEAGLTILVLLLVFAVLAVLMVKDVIAPIVAGFAGAIPVFAVFFRAALGAVRKARAGGGSTDNYSTVLWKEDRLWAGLLIATAIFMLYYFY